MAKVKKIHLPNLLVDPTYGPGSVCGQCYNHLFIDVHPALVTCEHCLEWWRKHHAWYLKNIGQEIAIPEEEDEGQMGGGRDAGGGADHSAPERRSVARGGDGLQVRPSEREEDGAVSLLPQDVSEDGGRPQGAGWPATMEGAEEFLEHKCMLRLERKGVWYFVFRCEDPKCRRRYHVSPTIFRTNVKRR